jgi:nucleoside-triphosphatase THEP1
LIKSIEILKERKVVMGGMYSPKIFERDERIGYDVVDVSSNEREMFLRNNLNGNFEKVGSFSILPQGLKLGLESLKLEKTHGKQLIVIDEIGSLELSEKGWFERIDELFKSQKINLLIVVREELVVKVIEKWNLSNYTFFNINENDHLSISNQIIEYIRSYTSDSSSNKG